MFQFQKATKTKSKLRLAIIGPSGSGKTYSALAISSQLGNKIAVMDTERGSASKYADLFKFDVLEPDTFAPEIYIQAIEAAEKAGYDVLVIDSLSHAWVGKDGALEMVDREAAKSRSGNSFAAWRNVTPIHNRMVDAIVSANMHVIATMRSKMEYVIQTDERGKQVPKKIGMQPVQRDGLEYEFDLVADMDMDNNLIVGKSRCPALTGKLFNKPGQDVADILKAWLTDGVDIAPNPEDKQLDQPKQDKKQEQTNQPTPPKTSMTRPLDANSLLDALRRKAGTYGTRKANDKQRSLLAILLSNLFEGDNDKRHTLQAFLFGSKSLNDVNDHMVLAALDWLKPTQDSGGAYIVDAMSATEAKSAYHAAAIDQAVANGQQGLPLD